MDPDTKKIVAKLACFQLQAVADGFVVGFVAGVALGVTLGVLIGRKT